MADKLIELIQSFGFTDKETEAFITILEEGPITVQEIVEQSDISRRHTYNAIDNLQQYNFVVVNEYLTPATVEPAPPQKVYQQVQHLGDQLYEQLESRYRRSYHEQADVKVLKSRSTVTRTIRDMVSSARRRVGISIPLQFLPVVHEQLVDAVDRNVATMLLLTDFEEDQTDLDAPITDAADVIRYRDDPGLILLAVDRESALVAPPEITNSQGQRSALYSSQPHLESVAFTTLMEYEWQMGEEFHVASPRGLPTTYSNVRKAVIDATLYMNDEVSLVAEVEARPVDNSDTVETITGDVVRVGQRLISPITTDIPYQSCLYIDTGDEVVTAGGVNATLEDHRALSIKLDAAPSNSLDSDG
ncbi:TrmB family transcriptional regulator sugar-binding domain-containing protein [Halorhabdus rudnickae]|uniref:TrmB family transcriptional regulator sugar-binding domain-containing protein n=1 Tax=Halorhabdus rudnickae TaxID=1775544 RepID=UPI0010846816|nr:TrmB family transcriptional regulator sugar-binding domain-containing protein [Halorhabdus rudnickae]